MGTPGPETTDPASRTAAPHDPSRRRRRRRVLVAAAGATVLVATVAVTAVTVTRDDEPTEDELPALTALPSLASTPSTLSQPEHGVDVTRDVEVEVRDGTRVSVDVYRPDTDEPVPALYTVSPYRKDLADLPAVPIMRDRETGPIAWWVERGYAVVVADTRGTGGSGGEWQLFDTAEQHDMYDTIEWIADQSWSSGRVGMTGASYHGISQWHAAAQRPPSLAAIAPVDAGVDLYRDVVYHGGVLNSGFVSTWGLQTRARTMLDHPAVSEPPDGAVDFDVVGEILQRPVDSPWWQERSPLGGLDEVTVPTLSVGTYPAVGIHLRGNVVGYQQVSGPKRLLLMDGDGQALIASEEFQEKVLLPWFDHWLKGRETGVLDSPEVRYWVTGAQEYRTADTWPPASSDELTLHLSPEEAGAVASVNDGSLVVDPPGDEGETSLTYPHEDWEIGTAAVTDTGVPDPTAGILTFTTPPLEEAVEIAGPIELELDLSSDQLDTDVVVRLADQAPQGIVERTVVRQLAGDLPPPATIVSRGWMRASHRGAEPDGAHETSPYYSHDDPVELEPGAVETLRIEIWPRAHRFEAGHRIRLEVAPGDSAAFEAPFTHHYGARAGTDTIHHGPDHTSRLVLPVTPTTE